MMHINLLDWRRERRELRKRQFFAMLGAGAVLAGAIVAGGVMTAEAALDAQRARNDFLRAQIAEADRKIKEIQELEKVKNGLLARMRVIEELQASRSATVHFFDELVDTLPDGVTLTSVKQTGSSVIITGVAESNGRISAYLKNLDASEWFDDPRLIVIRTTEQNLQRESGFELEVRNLTQATTDAAEDAGAPE